MMARSGMPVRLAVLVLGVGLTSSAVAQGAGRDEVVARLGSTELRASEVLRLSRDQAPGTKQEAPHSAESLARIATAEVFRRAVLAEARARGWENRPEVVAQIERAREQVVVAAYMNDVTRPPAAYPGEQELNEAYRASQAELTVPKQLRLGQIYLSAEKYPDAAKRKAEELARKAREKPASFGELARANSEHKPSADKDGDMGWLPEDAIVREVREAVANAGAGEIVGPVRTAQGWHVVRMLEAKPAAVRPLSDVRDVLIAHMRQRKALENERRYLDDLAEKMKLTIDQEALARMRTTESTSKTRN